MLHRDVGTQVTIRRHRREASGPRPRFASAWRSPGAAWRLSWRSRGWWRGGRSRPWPGASGEKASERERSETQRPMSENRGIVIGARFAALRCTSRPPAKRVVRDRRSRGAGLGAACSAAPTIASRGRFAGCAVRRRGQRSSMSHAVGILSSREVQQYGALPGRSASQMGGARKNPFRARVRGLIARLSAALGSGHTRAEYPSRSFKTSSARIHPGSHLLPAPNPRGRPPTRPPQHSTRSQPPG